MFPFLSKIMKSNFKTFLIVLLSVLSIGACVGGVYAVNKHLESKTSSTTTPEVVESTPKTNTKTSSSDEPVSSNSTIPSSSISNHNENTVPTINCSLPQEVYWYNTEDQVDLNESLLVATLNGLPANATEDDKELYIWSDDDDLDEWIEISQTKNGNKVILSSPYVFHSGDTLHLKQIKEAPATGFYKIPLWIYAVNYEPSQVSNCVDIWFQQR